MGENNRNLKKLIKIYKPDGYDWMNFALTRRNPYTFHHILSRSDGGKDLVENGAILTRRAHDLLHLLEFVCPEAYNDLQIVFDKINKSYKPLTEDIIYEIDTILYNIFNKENYAFKIDTDLSEYIEMYYKTKNSITKKLRK